MRVTILLIITTIWSSHGAGIRWRYLTFPIGSNAIINLSFSNAYMWELSPSPTWNQVVEFDLGFYLPNSTLLYPRSRQRRELLLNIESLLEVYGVNGRSCVQRAQCESKMLLRPGRSLFEDVLYTVFRESQEDKNLLGQRGTRCDMDCPFSILWYLLQGSFINEGK